MRSRCTVVGLGRCGTESALVLAQQPHFSPERTRALLLVSAPIFDVHFGDINVKPRTLSVRTSTGDVSVNNIEADASDIRVDTGSIRGNFIVTESLTLRTATGSIIANVSMLSSTTFPQQPPTVASIKTNTGSIDTRFSLFAIDSKNNAQVSSGGFFDVDARSDASSIRVRFDDAPVDSTLVLTSKTSTGPINVDPHPTYEGAFSLSSDVSSPVVSVKDDVEDPAGKDRKRTVKFIHTRNRAMVGEVVWGNAHVDGSRVDLKSDAGTPRLSI
ncbi:hypothetical protein BDM02DRAFT_498157 [Thelephora ganbajun]|uniref:Uncharacterized protein n=1 Tax=Thelephora ganbajun TaxID=370292 RepID=A0ACB6Z7E7_THEGA|nr:hypothetical protein BDM02DRAFT_498157 [Thelephora ganbajun]